MWESIVSSLSNWMDGGIIHYYYRDGGRADLRTTNNRYILNTLILVTSETSRKKYQLRSWIHRDVWSSNYQ